jgi:hypothetical protein
MDQRNEQQPEQSCSQKTDAKIHYRLDHERRLRPHSLLRLTMPLWPVQFQHHQRLT